VKLIKKGEKVKKTIGIALIGLLMNATAANIVVNGNMEKAKENIIKSIKKQITSPDIKLKVLEYNQEEHQRFIEEERSNNLNNGETQDNNTNE